MIPDAETTDRPAPPDAELRGRHQIGLRTPGGGRLFRALFAVAALWYRIDRDSRFATGYFLRTVLWFAVVTVGFVLLHLALSRIARDRLSPWLLTAILQLPLLAYPLQIGPAAFHDGIGLYTLLGFVLNPLLGYGGAEVAALPSLLTRRRPRTYTPFNLIDLVESALRDGRHRRGLWWGIATLVFAGTLIAFWIVPLLLVIHPVQDRWPGASVPPVGALAFLAPAILLAVRYRRDRTEFGAQDPSVVLEGRAALALPALIVAGDQVPDLLWGGILLVAVIVAVRSLVRRGAAAPSRPAL